MSVWLKKRYNSQGDFAPCARISTHPNRVFILPRTVNVLIWAIQNLFLWKPAWNTNKSCNLLVSSILLKLLHCAFVESLEIQSLWDEFIYGCEGKDKAKIFSCLFSKCTEMLIALIEILTHLPWGKTVQEQPVFQSLGVWGFFVELIEKLHFSRSFNMILKKCFWKYKKLSVFQFVDCSHWDREYL